MTAYAAFAHGLLLYLSIICAVGPQNLFLVQQGVSRNRPARFAAASAFADISLMSLGALGFSAALVAAPSFHLGLSLLGVGFLGIYGAVALRAAFRPAADLALPLAGKAGLLAWAAITLLNPVYYVDNIVVIGGTAAGFDASFRALFLLGCCFGALLWFFGLVFSAERAGAMLLGPVAQRFLNLAGGLVMLWTAASLLGGLSAASS